MSHQYYCENLQHQNRDVQRGAETTKVRPLRTFGPYFNTTIKGRKIA